MANLKRMRADSWLETWNPLRGLSIQQAVGMWDNARRGDTQRLHWLFQEIEAANPVLMTCVERRASALAAYSPVVTVQPSADQVLGDEQKDAAEHFLAGIDNFQEALEHLDNGFFRGFAFIQPLWEADGCVRTIALPNSWEFVTHEGVLYHNPEGTGWNEIDCVDCSDARLVGIRRRRAIDYPALSIHIRAAVGERDWGRFLERVGIPKPAVTMAQNATNEQRRDYLESAVALENGQVSVWPYGTLINDFAGGARGADPFNNFIEHQEKLIVLLSTGGTLTSLAQADTGSLAGGAQMDVWHEIVARDSAVIGQSLMRGMVRPYLEAKFPGRGVAIDFRLDKTSQRTPKEAAELAGLLKAAGYTVDQSELEKAVGFTLSKDEGMAGGMGMMNTDPTVDQPSTVQPSTVQPTSVETVIADELASAIAESLKGGL